MLFIEEEMLSFIVSLFLILGAGYFSSKLFEKLSLPGLLGMLFVGVVLGPHFLNLISSEIIMISEDIRFKK